MPGPFGGTSVDDFCPSDPVSSTEVELPAGMPSVPELPLRLEIVEMISPE